MSGYNVNTSETMRPKQPCPCFEADHENTPCPRMREDATHLTEYCVVHNNSVYVIKKSEIPDAGRGLFYNGDEPLKPSQKNKKTHPLFAYGGPKIEGHVSQETPGYENNDYLVYVKSQNHTINQIDPTNSTMARWINDSQGPNKKKLYNNCAMIAHKGEILVKVVRKINKGDELLIAYSHTRVPKAQRYWSAPTERKEERKEEKEEKTTTTRSGKDEVQYSDDDDDDPVVPTGYQHNPRQDTGGKHPRFIPIPTGYQPNPHQDTGGKHPRFIPIEKEQEREYLDLFSMDEDATDDNNHDEPQLYDEEDPALLEAMAKSRQTAASEATGRGKRKRTQTEFLAPTYDELRSWAGIYGEKGGPYRRRAKPGPKRLSPSEIVARERSRYLKKKLK
jgi:hypothetical protein